MTVAVLGTSTNVTISVSGNVCCNPARVEALKPRGATFLFQRSNASSQPTKTALAKTTNTIGQHDAIRRRLPSNIPQSSAKAFAFTNESTCGKRRGNMSRLCDLRYEPKHAAGMAMSFMSLGNSIISIHLVYSSRPGGALTLKTLGTAATHWYKPTSALTLNCMPASRQSDLAFRNLNEEGDDAHGGEKATKQDAQPNYDLNGDVTAIVAARVQTPI
eukprot:7386171-Prymnesium_polylepis.3